MNGPSVLNLGLSSGLQQMCCLQKHRATAENSPPVESTFAEHQSRCQLSRTLTKGPLHEEQLLAWGGVGGRAEGCSGAGAAISLPNLILQRLPMARHSRPLRTQNFKNVLRKMCGHFRQALPTTQLVLLVVEKF